MIRVAMRLRGARVALLWPMLCGGLLGEASAAPRTAPVSLGEVSALASDSELSTLFRHSVEQELSKLDLSTVRSRERFILSASLTSVRTRRDTDESETTARVTATLRKAQGGQLHAIVRGNARATESPKAARAAARAAVQAAVRSALRRVPDAL